MKKISIIIILFVALLLAFILLWQPIASNLIGYYLQNYFQKSLNSELQVAQIHHKNGLWIIEQPQLSGAISGNADSMTVGCTWNLLQRTLDLDVTIHNPKIILQQQQLISSSSSESSLQSSSKQHSDFFIVNGKLNIPEGIVIYPYTQTLEQPQFHQVHFQLEGKWQSQEEGQYAIKLHVPNTDENSLEVMLSKTKDQLQKTSLNMHNVDFGVVSATLPYWTQMNGWSTSEGKLNGEFEIALLNDQVSSIKGNVQIQQLTLCNSKHQLTATVPSARILFDDISTSKGSFEFLEPATLTIQGIKGKTWSASDILGKVLLEPYQNVAVTLNAICSNGEDTYTAHINGQKNLTNGHTRAALSLQQANKDDIEFHLDTHPINDSAYALILQLQNCPLHPFNQDHIDIDAVLNNNEVNGTLKIANEVLTFGFTLERENENHSKIVWQRGLSLVGLSLKEGWFSASQIPLKKYIDPIINNRNPLHLTGFGDIYGSFNSNNLVINYDTRDLTIENELIALHVSSLSTTTENALPAIHYIDLNTGVHGGLIPLTDATLFAKKANLTFTNIQAQITLDQHKAFATNVEAYCKGIYCAGDVIVDYSKQSIGCYEIDVHAHTMSGKISQLRQLFSEPHQIQFLEKFPVEGDVALRPDGARLHLTLLPDDLKVQAWLHGALTDGAFLKQGSHLSLRDLNFNFDYDLNKKMLEFSEIQGVVLVGSPEHMEEYLLAGDHVRCTSYANSETEFDLWIGDRNRDIIRLVGKTHTVPYQNAFCVECLLDHNLSHFGDVHPDNFRLILTNWSQVELMDLKFRFQLSTLLHDLQRFSRTGLFFLSRRLLQELNNIKEAEGDFQLDVKYDNQTSLFTYNAESLGLSFGKYKFKEAILNGKKKDNIWTIDQLKLDHLTFASEFSHNDENWIVNFLGVKVGKSLLMGLEGIFSPNNYTLDAKVNLLEANLAYLDEWTGLRKFVLANLPKGEMRATGTMQLAWTKNRPGLQVEAQLNTSLRSLELQGFTLPDVDNIHCNFVSNPTSLQLIFPEGQYQLFGTKYNLNRFILECDPFELRLNTELVRENEPFLITMRSAIPNFKSGSVTVCPKLLDESLKPIVIHWQRDAQGMSIQNVEGTCKGLSINLKKSEKEISDKIVLKGEITIDPRQANHLLSKEFNEAIIACGVNGNFLLQGDWSLPAKDPTNWHSEGCFSGTVKGSNCKFKEYEVDRCSMKMEYGNHAWVMKDIHVEDTAGSLEAENLDLKQRDFGVWQMTIPNLTIKDFRPSRVRSVNGPWMPAESTFIIKSLELKDISCNPFDITTLHCTGSAHAANPPKHGKPNPLLDIPTDETAKNELDVTALIPVTGNIQFEIADQKIYLKKFKDMYSAGRLSKFYLPKKAEQPSYIDFDGNVFIQVKMKQYNLLYKLAELFTVTIQGKWEKPTFSIQKQHSHEEDAE